MKEVYIIFDRYEHNEWFSVYHLGVNEEKAWRYFRETALPDFLNYGPDDCHSFQMQCVTMSDYKYRKLRALVNASDKEHELHEFMLDIYEYGEYEAETLVFTDGCSDNIEIAQMYAEEHSLDYDEDQDVIWEALSEEEVWSEYMRRYIDENY